MAKNSLGSFGFGRMGFGSALHPAVKPRKNTAGKIKAIKDKYRRVANHATEVMVKVTGGSRGAAHLKSHIDYIGRNGDIPLENENGEILETRERVREEHKEWADDLGKPRANQRDSIHIVLSMPEGTAPEAVRAAARDFAKEHFGQNHRYLMALHCAENDKDTKNPHVHLSVKSLGHDGSRLDPKKADLAHWRESFAEQMRRQGYEAEATPRRARGVITKGTRAPVRAMMDDKERPGRSKVFTAKVREAAEHVAGKPTSANPHRSKIVEQQKRLRQQMLADAEQLEREGDKELAGMVKRFVASMPKELNDERAKLQKLVRERLQPKHQDQDQDQDQEHKQVQDKGRER